MTNNEKFLEIIRTADTELYMIKMALEETGVPPIVLTHVIRALGTLLIGHGFGKVQINMQAKIITNIESTEKVKLDT